MKTLRTNSTSRNSAEIIDPIVLDEKKTTRKVAYFRMNDKYKSINKTVSVKLIHQRKGANDKWEDVQSVNLTTLKAGEGVRLDLDCSMTQKLYQKLKAIYEYIEINEIPIGSQRFIFMNADNIIKVPASRREVIKRLLSEDYGKEIWNELDKVKPGLTLELSMARIQMQRVQALRIFEENLAEGNSNEDFWQNFFEQNQWIFGYGLDYRFLYHLENQPSYGGMSHTGKGNQKGDFLLHTQAKTKFTVLVEIKTPKTPLLAYTGKATMNREPKEIRNDTWLLSTNLLGGVSQIQVNCRTWSIDSQRAENVRSLENSGVFTVEPKGILVIGNMSELSDDESMVSCFETFRRNIKNPEILTFDELYERAKFIVDSNEGANEMCDKES